jgi:hypothetical protein
MVKIANWLRRGRSTPLFAPEPLPELLVSSWNTAQASVVGSSHTGTGDRCQDSARYSAPDRVFVAAVSDGAGTAKYSAEGSKHTADTFVSHFSKLTPAELQATDKDAMRAWVGKCRSELGKLAAAAGHEARAYSCTLLGAIVWDEGSIFIQVGDGAIVVGTADEEDYNVVFWPQHGEYANSTYFVTQDIATEIMDFEKRTASILAIAMFTDGIEHLVLDFSSQKAFSPAFRPIFRWLSTQCGANSDEVIDRYLRSNSIQSRTDDDTTLLMAHRR